MNGDPVEIAGELEFVENLYDAIVKKTIGTSSGLPDSLAEIISSYNNPDPCSKY